MARVHRVNQIARYLMLVTCGHLAAQEVIARDGDIMYVDKLGRNHEITHSGKDRDPSLSPDGASIVFVRRTGETKMTLAVEREPVCEFMGR